MEGGREGGRVSVKGGEREGGKDCTHTYPTVVDVEVVDHGCECGLW